MTEKELSKFYYLRKEIEDIDSRIEELEETGGVSGIRYREVDVMSTPVNKTILDRLDKLIDLWKERRVSAIEEYLKIQSYIESIEEPEIRQIMRYRFLDLMEWQEIGKILNYDRTTVSKKVRNYLKEQLSHNSHE